MEELVGKTLLTGTTKRKTADVLKGKTFVGLYFSANWCPPCKAFSPVLKQFYELTKNDVEVVYVSSDRKTEEFKEYYGTMPWSAMPYGDEEATKLVQTLAKRLSITGIPTLVVLDVKTGKFVTNQARTQVETAMHRGSQQAGASELLEQWKAAEPLTLEEGVKRDTPGFSLKNIVLLFLKNPIWIFAVMYFAKYIMRKMKTIQTGGGGEDVVPPGEEIVPEDEF
jgi:nucleoredoxin